LFPDAEEGVDAATMDVDRASLKRQSDISNEALHVHVEARAQKLYRTEDQQDQESVTENKTAGGLFGLGPWTVMAMPPPSHPYLPDEDDADL